MSRFEVIGFDADDTLWHSEDGFHHAEETFVQMVEPYAPAGVDVMAALTAQERADVPVYGYGVKAFTLSMIRAALTVSANRIPQEVIGSLVDLGRNLLLEPVRLIDGVPWVLEQVGREYRMVLITKGDLIHQTRKVTTSGIDHHFEHVEILLEKDPETYQRILRDRGIDPATFLMVGNSVKSDVLPVLALGGSAVHVPYHVTWALEHADHDEEFAELAALTDLPDWLAAQS